MLVCVFVSAVIIANYRNMSLIQINVYIFYKWNWMDGVFSFFSSVFVVPALFEYFLQQCKDASV